jgi:putative hydrolase
MTVVLGTIGSDQHPSAVSALREIGFWLERSRADTHRVRAYRRAADAIEQLDADQLEEHRRNRSWGEIAGVGPKTAAVIAEAEAGQVPASLAKLREAAQPLAAGGQELQRQLRGDLHVHSDWSDGGSPLEETMATARDLGHEYCAITDHSPRLKVARGLSAERLRQQMKVVDDLRAELAPFEILHGIEVDILTDGGLDQEPALLSELDVVVASVHSELRSDSESMTHRMVAAIANPRVNVLGHCTGRLIEGERGLRPESVFDAEVVFEACKQFNTAVEINSRPERRDPPTRLLQLAYDMGCLFSIDTDAHAPGQLDFQAYGAERAASVGIEPERIINTWPVDRLKEWCRPG